MIRDSYGDTPQRDRQALSASPVFVCILFAGLILFSAWFLGSKAYHFSDLQMTEFFSYALLGIGVPGITVWVLIKRRAWKESQRRYPPLVMSPAVDAKHVEKAWEQNAVVLGYDLHGAPWLWPDKVRVMQGIVVGMTGSGKTTLLKNIITQDLARGIGPVDDRHKIPMVIFDGKGDLDFFYELLPHINRAGRLGDLRLINPARPDTSCLYNPFHSTDENYMAQVNMVFGSFNLHDEFFAKHQLNYLADIVRILHYTGMAFNFYDVIVMALDQDVLREQIEKARAHMRAGTGVSMQRGLNFEMSVRNLVESFNDRERVPKIQGLLNECMTFLDDELSVITGPYEDLLSIDDVIDQELILFVTLNINKNTEPVRALGKMLLQNLQLVVGKRYESEQERKRKNRPILSVVLDEFAPFGYRNFAQILQTARGTNTAFLFSMQSLPQLLQVGKGFKDDVTSAPNTKIAMRTQDEETSRFFIRASAEHTVTKRTVSLVRDQVFGWERFERGVSGSEREEREYRAQDERIKNLPKGQMEILMTDDTEGTLHRHLHVRTPPDVELPGFDLELAPRVRQSRLDVPGANLRFKDPGLAASFGRRMHGRR
ncbi:MAG: type IV secretory system conjugative DNA transfer family protein [Bryobacteraceae bacterium]|nr:type IV secretory system conjugative DNA transfer family protein [Bryobacteraceae bacterium]